MSFSVKRRTNGVEQWGHIEDAKERKKIQNRNAQRSYRERLKRRVEVLEQLYQSEGTTVLVPQRTKHAARNMSPQITMSGEDVMRDAARKRTAIPTTSDNFREIETIFSEKEDSLIADSTLSLSVTPSFKGLYPSLKSSCNMGDRNASTSPVNFNWWLDPSFEHANVSSLSSDNAINMILDQETAVMNEKPVRDMLSPQLLDGHSSPSDGQTALHIAARSGKIKSVVILLKMSAEILAKDYLGQTALHIAVDNSHEAVVAELAKYKRMLDELNQNGETALHIAVFKGEEKIALLLLMAGSNTELKDRAGRTALHIAAMQGSDTILKLLLEQGADVDAEVQSS